MSKIKVGLLNEELEVGHFYMIEIMRFMNSNQRKVTYTSMHSSNAYLIIFFNDYFKDGYSNIDLCIFT